MYKNGFCPQEFFYVQFLFRYIDADLGEEIPEKDYGGTCRIYDNDNPSDPWHNVKVLIKIIHNQTFFMTKCPF